jgi:hypothetical protein
MAVLRRVLVGVGLVVLLGGAAIAYLGRGPALLPLVQIGRIEGVIVPLDALDQELHQCSRSTPEGGAVPRKIQRADLVVLEELLPAYVAANPPKRTQPIAANLSNYGRRYSGLLRNGQPAIYVALVSRDPFARSSIWRTRTWGICDGGSAAFGVEFSSSTRSFTHIAYNGEL